MNKLYKIIEDLCDSRGIDVQQMSKEIGIHRNVMPRLKANPDKDLSQKTREKIADYFNVPLDFLRSPVEYDPRDIPPEPEISDSQLMFALWGDVKDELTADDLEDVKKYADMVRLRKLAQKKEDE